MIKKLIQFVNPVSSHSAHEAKEAETEKNIAH